MGARLGGGAFTDSRGWSREDSEALNAVQKGGVSTSNAVSLSVVMYRMQNGWLVGMTFVIDDSRRGGKVELSRCRDRGMCYDLSASEDGRARRRHNEGGLRSKGSSCGVMPM